MEAVQKRFQRTREKSIRSSNHDEWDDTKRYIITRRIKRGGNDWRGFQKGNL